MLIPTLSTCRTNLPLIPQRWGGGMGRIEENSTRPMERAL